MSALKVNRRENSGIETLTRSANAEPLPKTAVSLRSIHDNQCKYGRV